MELREFAERILFSTRLEDKLWMPDGITDERPGPAWAAPDSPGRPAELRFKPTGLGQSHEFPGLTRIDDERERGRLLHFFANHELLAVELMALVLLRFPEAPPDFRQGVLKTLRDEQHHTRLYLERMRACGIAFGELPVSGFFWRCIAPMENPIDYVAGLSLTFEQANLDFARLFSEKFAAAGDADSAALLEKIYRDEIGHVAYGLKWFRRWKNPQQSDWDAFCRQLKFPLSPQRAKGVIFNAQGRRAAGLDAGFVAELEVYAQSRGRTPGVFLFNSFAEAFVARGRGFSPNRKQAWLQSDLENLPQFLCRQDDVVLVSKRPSVSFLARLQQQGFALPEFQPLDRLRSALEGRKLGNLRPWAWSPDSAEILQPLRRQIRRPSADAAPDYNPAMATLYSKAWSADLLRTLLARTGGQPWLCEAEAVGQVIESYDEAVKVMRSLRAMGFSRLVAKECIGLAGQNALRLWEPELTPPQRAWMRRVLQRDGNFVLEPWLDRIVDFSVQLEMRSSGLKLCGYSGLMNDHRGQYAANWAEPSHRTRLPVAVSRALHGPFDVANAVLRWYEMLRTELESRLAERGFRGAVGVDAFVYRSVDGSARLKPVVEVNPRHTMGRLTLDLMRRTVSGSCGMFRLVNRSALKTAGCAGLAEFAAKLTRQMPLRLDQANGTRIRSGAVCLTDPEAAKAGLAVFMTGRSRDDILGDWNEISRSR